MACYQGVFLSVKTNSGASLSTCRVCDNGETTQGFCAVDYITKDEFNIYTCSACGTGFTSPCPVNLDPYYPKYYRRYNLVTEAVMKILFDRRVRGWLKRLGPSGRALEVGCGNGWMLKSLAAHGWEVLGLERTEEMAKHAREVTGLPVTVGGLEDLPRTEKFDLIIMYNVLEHVWEPLEILRNCSELLSKKGQIIVVVPNFSSWQARLCGAHWFHLDVPRHLIQFSRTGLERAFAAQGMCILSQSYVSWEHDPYGWVQSVLNLVGFKQNRLTRGLMGHMAEEFGSLAGVFTLVCAALLAPLALVTAIISWPLKAGALVEVWGAKKCSLKS